MYSILLEVVVSLSGILLVLSLFCSALWEAWAQSRGTRGRLMSERISNMLGGGATFEKVFRHPLLTTLATETQTSSGPVGRFVSWLGFASLRPTGAHYAAGDALARGLPSYIPPRLFATAALSVASGRRIEDAPADFTATRAGIIANELLPPEAKERFVALLDAGRNGPKPGESDLDRVRGNVGVWFEGAMDRLSGTYQRKTQHALFWIALVVAAVTNLDTISMGRALWTDSSLRQSIVASTETMMQRLNALDASSAGKPGAANPCAWAADAAECNNVGASQYFAGDLHRQLRNWSKAGLPVGWDGECKRIAGPQAATGTTAFCIESIRQQPPAYWAYKILGLLLTALFASFGAPFWFDLLNRIFRLRGAGLRPSSSTASAAGAQTN
jgi:hypothetical protein